MMRQFHDFFLLFFFGGFFPIWSNCAPEEKNGLTYASNEDFHYLYLTSMYVLLDTYNTIYTTTRYLFRMYSLHIPTMRGIYLCV